MSVEIRSWHSGAEGSASVPTPPRGKSLSFVSHHMTFSVRPALPEDAEAACNAVRTSIEECCAADHEGEKARLDAWLKNKSPENFCAWIQSESLYCVVVEECSRIVGFGMSAPGEVLLCYVFPEVRFRGAGKAMLQAIELWAATSGVPELKLESTRTALAFYRRNGFKISGPAITFAGMEGQPMSKQVMANLSIERTGESELASHVKCYASPEKRDPISADAESS